jgi:small subunit ribosomal protein S1
VGTFAATHKKGDKVSGQIKSITDFGMFIGLDGGIDGLVHLSDISWNTTGEDVVRNFKKGDTLEAVVLAVDPERERISWASSSWSRIRSASTWLPIRRAPRLKAWSRKWTPRAR